MFRNYLAAALRNLSRNRLYASINITGLAMGFAAAILIALFVRDEFSYESFMPDRDRTYLAYEIVHVAQSNPLVVIGSPGELAGWLKADFASIEAITRLAHERTSLRRGEVEANEAIYWCDPNVFDVLQLPAAFGDLKSALTQPDGIVLTRKMARKYFGRDDPVGAVIEIAREHPMRVTAVLEDLPSNTHLDGQIYASGRAAISPLTINDAKPPPLASGNNSAYVLTYLRLQRGASLAELQQALPAFVKRHARVGPMFSVSFPLLPIGEVHLHPEIVRYVAGGGGLSAIYAVAVIGVLIVLVAGINFVNLMTARTIRRATEVGVRKVMGAARSHLIVQFIGESVLYVMFSMILAMALAELLLPHFNAFLDRSLVFDYWRDPRFAGAILAFVLLAGVMAGAYPALVLAAFPPVFALRGGVLSAAGSGAVRQILVVLQFAILIGMLIATSVIYRQSRYAMEEGLRLDHDQVLLVETTCQNAFKEEILSLPGVRAAACSDAAPSLATGFQPAVFAPDGTAVLMWNTAVDFGYFELYGLKPLAGRFFSRDHVADAAQEKTSGDRLHAIVVNETGLRKLGFKSPQEAIGRTIGCTGPGNRDPCEIIGVVPDYAEDSVRTSIEPAFYQLAHRPFRILSVKLRGTNVPETLQAIDRLWKQAGDPKPINRVFLDQRVQEMYANITRQTWLFSVFAAIAACIACLGLFGLSAFTAERRTKEIGVRKAMGAGTGDIARLMVWQFTKPVLWATLVAWPLGAWSMNRWLHGFAYHIDLQPWLFVASAATALLIALLTVGGHCYLVARAKPASALRDE